MATFYLLPTRERLEHEVAAFWRRTLPGVPVPPGLGGRFLEQVERSHPAAYFVHREDLPGDGGVDADLVAHFGATAGDEVVEVGGTGVSELRSDR